MNYHHGYESICEDCGQHYNITDGTHTCLDVVLQLRSRVAELEEALQNMFSLIEEHGESTIRAHATRLMEIRKVLIHKMGIS